ncbi:ClpXP protease specificity-enhancing factor SspB [Telmatospirillum sp.]|uniref:SspB family protein n=1 Tax=Telmatospirillum sp. TaxID=2079197 RepID=UPI0028471D9B|nr:ClpXP protease specificity-enhancing factor SspB [Telmatospirillum sp.]MDR3437683.1 ClpXP protease specificity-enhancing factor SspB [Telmatospirillum sp.]
MANTVLRYDKMVEDALRGVLRDSLIASQDGLPGDHHFYITFRTRHPGVEISDQLMARYPDEMTIVIQHQFWGLEVTPEWFEVTLSFNRINERLHIPFSSVTAFADPSAKFGLQFQVDPSIEIDSEGSETEDAALAEEASKEPRAETETNPAGDAGGQVIALDAFRKK